MRKVSTIAESTDRCPDRLDRLGGRKAGDVFVPVRPRLAGGIKSRGVSGVSPEAEKALQFLTLTSYGDGHTTSSVFM